MNCATSWTITGTVVERLTASVEAWFTAHFKTHDARLHSRLGAHPH
jgi:hypothetical protein